MIRLYTILLFLTSAAQASPIYLSTTDGNDTRTLTQARSSATPWQTLTKLNTVIAGLGAGDTVYFKRGDVFPGTISQAGNGTTGNPVVFADYGTGAKPIISGFLALTSWTSLGSNMWSASINSGDFMDVMVRNNQFVMMGRTPNAGSYFNIDSHQNPTGGAFDVGFTGQTLTSTSIPAGSQNWQGGRAFIRKNQFNSDRDFITSHSSNTIAYATHNGNPIKNDGNKFFIQAHIATVTAQNEWYYDPVAHVVKMYSTSDPGSMGYMAGQYDFAYRVNNQTGTNSHDVTFRNLVFQGYDSIALCFLGMNNMTVKNCEFYYIGANAIETTGTEGYGNYSCNNLIADSNIIEHCGNAGIDCHFTQGGVRIRYNNIDSCGAWEDMGLPNNQQRDGIQVEYPDGNDLTPNRDSVIIVGNTVKHSGYCGIRFEGGWAKILNNYVDGFGLMQSDGGGIYTSRNRWDSVTNYRLVDRNKVINGIGDNRSMNDPTNGGMPGVYYDDRSVNIITTHNVISGETRSGILLHNNANMIVQYNDFYNNNDDAAISSEYDGLEPGFVTRGLNIRYNNVYAGTGRLIHFYSYTGSDVASYGVVNNNYYSRSSTTNMFKAQQGGTVSEYSSVSAWNAGFGYDAASAYKTVLVDSMKLFSNTKSVADTAKFPGKTYIDLQGVTYSDSRVLGPFENFIGINVSYIASVLDNLFIRIRPARRKNYKIY